MDIMRMAHKLDVVVLVSGDGDFKDLLEHVKALGCRAEVVSFAKTTSARLTEVADDVLDLGKELDKVLIKDHRHPRPELKTEPPVQGEGPVQDSQVLPTEVLLNEGLQEKPKEFVAKPFQKGPFKKPFQKNFQNDRFNGKKPFNRFQRGDRRDRGDRGDRMERDDTNILQKINMDQPLLTQRPPMEPPKLIAESVPKKEVQEAPKKEEGLKPGASKLNKKPRAIKKKPAKEQKPKAEKSSESQTEEQKKESLAERIFGKKKRVE